MKKVLSLLLSGLVVFMMLGFGGGSVLAADGTDSGQAAVDNDCGCHNGVITLTGAERNKAVANLLKSDIFKDLKKQAIGQGYNWDGANSIMVSKYEQRPGFIGYVLPLTNKNGETLMGIFASLDGVILGGTLIPNQE